MMAQYSDSAAREMREVGRQPIKLEEINGNFVVDSDEVHFDSAIVNDVSVSGAGIELPVPLPVGSQVDLTFTAGDWKISVKGKVMWCVAAQQPGLANDLIDIFRLGIQFDARNTNNNVVFFMASRSMVNPALI